MKVSFWGTTTILFDDGTDQLLFDAHVTRPSFRRVMAGKLASDTLLAETIIRRFEVNRLRGMFLSHSHYDHVLDAPVIARKTGAMVYGSTSSLNVCRGGGVPEEQLRAFHGGEVFKVGDFTVQVIPSVHSPAHFYNNDLGCTIDRPLAQPARKRDFREGGSFDFLVSHPRGSYLIRPSCNYIPHQLDGVQANTLFLGVGGLSGMSPRQRYAFFRETVEKCDPETVIPIHWDNFFRTLKKPVRGMPRAAENSNRSVALLGEHCRRTERRMLLQWPLTTLEL